MRSVVFPGRRMLDRAPVTFFPLTLSLSPQWQGDVWLRLRGNRAVLAAVDFPIRVFTPIMDSASLRAPASA